MRSIAIFLAGAVLGAAVCAAVMVLGPGATVRPESESAGLESPRAQPAPPASEGRHPVAAASPGPGTIPAEVGILAERIAELRKSLAAETERRREAEGEPLRFPPSAELTNLEQRLAGIVEEALRPTQATVAAVDCLEYPCLTYIVAPPSFIDQDAQRAAMQSLIDALAKVGMLPASMSLDPADWGLSPADFAARQRPLAMALATEYPGAPISPEDRRRRVEARINQFFDALAH